MAKISLLAHAKQLQYWLEGPIKQPSWVKKENNFVKTSKHQKD